MYFIITKSRMFPCALVLGQVSFSFYFSSSKWRMLRVLHLSMNCVKLQVGLFTSSYPFSSQKGLNLNKPLNICTNEITIKVCVKLEMHYVRFQTFNLWNFSALLYYLCIRIMPLKSLVFHLYFKIYRK